MISVAAVALIAGTGFVNAQGTGSREAPSAGSAVQQSAPSSERAAPSATPMNRSDDSKGAEKTTQSDEKMQPQGSKKSEKSKSMSSETDNAKGAKDMKAEGREGRNGNMNAEQKSVTDSKSQTTTGQAGAGAKLSSEQRTKITTVIRDQHVQPLKNVNFSISVGTRVPRDVRFHPLPTEVVTFYPEWRGYEFILVNDQIIVVDPRTFEIVAVLEA
jgi:hypothetical protein